MHEQNKNIDEGSPTQLHLLSAEELIAAEMVVIKVTKRWNLKRNSWHYMVKKIRN